MEDSVELSRCNDYYHRAEDECRFGSWLNAQKRPFSLLLAEGFEERSLGLLRELVRRRVELPSVTIGRYVDRTDLNQRYREEFERLAEAVAPGRWDVVKNRNSGEWVEQALRGVPTQAFVLDISAISNRALFGALNAAIDTEKDAYVAYSEAKTYWPKHSDWMRLSQQLSAHVSLPELMDRKPWMFGYEHNVELILGHEGYDGSSSGRALVAFLHYKCARLAAVLGTEDYTEVRLIAGRPRLKKFAWRLRALRLINEPIVKGWPVVEMSTFNYRATLWDLSQMLLAEGGLLWRYDVHLAAMGSKLQTVACWAISSLVPSITVVTSVPSTYYPEAFSEGIGGTWVLGLCAPLS